MSQNLEKKTAGAAAADLVQDGMLLGLGTGSTVDFFLEALGKRVRDGLSVRGVPTSERTARLCRELCIPLAEISEVTELDLAIDGADEIDGAFRMIKGGGGALFREKVVASAAREVAIIVDSGKVVETLGAFPLPVEVVRFGHDQVARRLAAMKLDARLRMAGDDCYITDNGNYIYDLHLGRIADPEGLHAALKSIVGVVETGLFLGLCQVLVVGRGDRAEIRRRSADNC